MEAEVGPVEVDEDEVVETVETTVESVDFDPSTVMFEELPPELGVQDAKSIDAANSPMAACFFIDGCPP